MARFTTKVLLKLAEYCRIRSVGDLDQGTLSLKTMITNILSNGKK